MNTQQITELTTQDKMLNSYFIAQQIQGIRQKISILNQEIAILMSKRAPYDHTNATFATQQQTVIDLERELQSLLTNAGENIEGQKFNYMLKPVSWWLNEQEQLYENTYLSILGILNILRCNPNLVTEEQLKYLEEIGVRFAGLYSTPSQSCLYVGDDIYVQHQEITNAIYNATPDGRMLIASGITLSTGNNEQIVIIDNPELVIADTLGSDNTRGYAAVEGVCLYSQEALGSFKIYTTYYNIDTDSYELKRVVPYDLTYLARSVEAERTKMR
jgi:hypothetical protein